MKPGLVYGFENPFGMCTMRGVDPIGEEGQRGRVGRTGQGGERRR